MQLVRLLVPNCREYLGSILFKNAPLLICGFGLSEVYLTGDVHSFEMEDVGVFGEVSGISGTIMSSGHRHYF